MTPLQAKTYELLRQVPPGKVTTYKALADALNTKAYRAIGQYMRKNPYAPMVPCHRVVRSDGSIGGFMGNTVGKAIQQKMTLLRKEGISLRHGKIVNFSQSLHCFTDLPL